MTRTQSFEPLIESDDREFRDSGVPSTVAILGHPLHPLIVTFPIAFWVGAAGTDLGYWLTGDFFWARASFWLIGAGLLTSVLAAASGMSDFLRIGRVRKHKAGWIHMTGNIAAMGFSLVSFLLRLGDRAAPILPTGLILSIFVALLLGITGWYGGELIYRHKISVVGEGNPNGP